MSENTSSSERKISRLGQKQFREHLSSRGLLAWATIRSPRRDYLLVSVKHFSPRRNWTWEHLSNFQLSSPGREWLAWASYEEKPVVSTTLKLPCMPQVTKLSENQPTYTTRMIYPSTDYQYKRSTYHQFLQNHIIHART